jgi:transposase
MKTERKFKRADYAGQLEQTIRVGDFLPAAHLARFIVRVLKELDLTSFYEKYSAVGGEAYAPEVLLGLLLYSYATGIFSSRKIEKASSESLPHYYLAGGMHPDHDTLNQFRQTFLPEIKAIFVQVLLLAQGMGHLKLGNISIDGSKIHADASKHSAVSYGRLQELEAQFRQEIEELLTLAAQSDRQAWPSGFSPADEIELRQTRLVRLSEAKAVIEQRAEVRYQAEVAAHAVKLAERAEYEQRTDKKAKGRTPQAPTPGAQAKDQYNFTDPESRIMKQGNHDGFEQAYNAQAAVSHESRFIVANTLSNHPSDQNQALPTVAAIPEKLGKPTAAARDAGFFSAATIQRLTQLGIDPYIATGRLPHHPDWHTWLEKNLAPPPEDASPRLKMTYKLQTTIGQAIYRLRKSTVEPVIGIIKETLGFRQFSLRGLAKVAGEWNLVCLAYNLKRLHRLVFA